MSSSCSGSIFSASSSGIRQCSYWFNLREEPGGVQPVEASTTGNIRPKSHTITYDVLDSLYVTNNNIILG